MTGLTKGNGTIQPAKVFDQTVGLNDVPAGYRAMAGREALKVLIKPYDGRAFPAPLHPTTTNPYPTLEKNAHR
jgi:hypothetical protein